MKSKKVLTTLLVAMGLVAPVLTGCNTPKGSSSNNNSTSENGGHVDPDPEQNKYVIVYSGDARVNDTISFVLNKGTDPVTSEYVIEPKTAEDAEMFAFGADGLTATCLKEGKGTVVAKIDNKVVAELEITIARSAILSIKDTLDEVIKEIPFNGSAGTNSAKTETTYTVQGQVVSISKNKASDSTKYDGTVIIDDGTGAIPCIVYGNISGMKYVIGDSVQTTVKFTNYYGVLEAIATVSTATKQTSLYPDQLVKIEKAFTARPAEAMDGAAFAAYYAECKANGVTGSTKYTDVKHVTLSKVVGTGEEGSEYKTFTVPGDTSECNGKLSVTDTTSCTADVTKDKVSDMEGYMIGGNSSSKYLKLNITEQTYAKAESVSISSATGEMTTYVRFGLQLIANVNPVGAAIESIKWYSLNEARATIDENTGVLTGVASGYCGVKVVVNENIVAYSIVRVDASANPATGVTLDKSEASVMNVAGNTITLTPAITTKKPTTEMPCTDEIIWTSSDENVATVEDGVVTPVAFGKTTIFVQVGNYSASCRVTVVNQTLKDLDGAANNAVVDTYGVVMGKYTAGFWIGDGDRAFYVYKKPAELTAQIAVGDIVHVKGKVGFYQNVKQVASPTLVEVVNDYNGPLSNPELLTITKANAGTLGPNEQCRYSVVSGVVVASSGSTSITYTLKLSNDASIKVYLDNTNMDADSKADLKNKMVTGNLVTVYGFLGMYSGSYQLLNPVCTSSSAVTITGMTLDKTEANVYRGQKLQLNPVFTPEYAYSADVTWTVTGNDKVTVDNKGLVTVAADAVPDSTATVTATLGGLEASCVITAKKKDSVFVTDRITPTDIKNAGGSSSTSYKAFTGLEGNNSDAVYSGNTANGNSSIQTNSNGSPANRGIVSTTSGGTVAKIKVKFNSSTSATKTLNVYGKTTAYSSYTDLGSAGTKGTLIGTVVYTGAEAEVEITISGEYTYVGLISAGGAIYMDYIDITWDVA